MSEGQAGQHFGAGSLGLPEGTDEGSPADTEVVEKPAREETVVENTTPDYAAGLVSTQVGLRRCSPSVAHVRSLSSRVLATRVCCGRIYMCVYIRTYIREWGVCVYVCIRTCI